MTLKDWIAIVAIVVSISGIIYTAMQTSRWKEHDFAMDIYQETLLYKIPRARNKISFASKEGLTGLDSLIQEVKDLRRDTLYFRFTHAKVYKNLSSSLTDLEDFLTHSKDKNVKYNSIDEQGQWSDSLNEKLATIYDIFTKDLSKDRIDRH